MNKRTVDIIVISGILLLFIILFLKPICIFKHIFHIPCISCGLTRGFKAIIHLRLLDALKYNILSIPLFMFIVIFYSLYIISKIFNKNYVYNFYDFIVKHYKILLTILLIGWIINLFIYF